MDHAPPPCILLLDPDPRTFGDLPERLRARGHDVRVASDRDAAERHFAGARFDLVLAEVRCFGGPWLLERCDGPEPTGRILLETFGRGADGDEPGLHGVLMRPLDPSEAETAIERALRERELIAENRRLRAAAGPRFALGKLVSDEPRMGELFELARRVAPSRASVLILGESGTGKTELARAIHEESDRSEGPFVEVHCGALADGLLESELFGHAAGAFTGADRAREGKFEAASGGTLFLDELATAPLELQVKLLRALESGRIERVGETRTREVDVRVVCATNEDLGALVQSGRFREDLYFRIQVVVLEPPPLRTRPGDVVRIAERFLEELARRSGEPAKRLSPSALAACLAHAWPGNVRELRNALERAAILAEGPEILPADLPGRLSDPPAVAAPESVPPAPKGLPPVRIRTLADQLRSAERRILEQALEATGGHRGRASDLLGIGRSTLFEKLRKHGLTGNVPKDGSAA